MTCSCLKEKQILFTLTYYPGENSAMRKFLLLIIYTDLQLSAAAVNVKYGTVSHPLQHVLLLLLLLQVLRSSGDWSAGITTKDDSILQAMVHSIDFSEHFIYMEVCVLNTVPQP